MTDKRRLDALMRQGPIVLLIAAVSVFFWKVLTFAGVLFHFDLSGQVVPVRGFFFNNVAHGRFPLWSPDLCGGFPLFDEGWWGPLYPINYLLFTWLPSWYALNVSALLHAFGGAIGAYLYMKRSHSAAASALGAMLYIFGAPLVYHLVHFMFFETFCLFPWLFFIFDRYLEKGRISEVLGAAVVLGLMFMTGHPQGPALAVVAFGIYAMTLAAESWASGRPRIAAEITVAAAAIGLTALAAVSVIVAGMMHILAQSNRHEGMEKSFIYMLSLVPDALSRLASPAQHGHRGDLTSCAMDVFEQEVAVYLGLAVWCFLPLAFAGHGGRRDRAHLLVAVIGLFYILGVAGPFTGIIEHVPLLNRMRIPTRFVMPMSLSFAFLAASGFDRLRGEDVSRRKATLLLLGGALAWCLVAGGGALAAFGRGAFAGPAPGPHLDNTVETARVALRADLVLRCFLAAALVVASLLLLWRRGTNPLLRAALTFVVGAVVFADLAAAGERQNPVINPAYYRPQATLDFLLPRLDGYRIYPLDTISGNSRGGWMKGTDSFRDSLEDLPQDTPALFGVRSMACNSPLIFARDDKAFTNPTLNWLRQASVKYVLTRHDQAFHLPKATTADHVQIFEVPDPAPIYSLARRVKRVADGNAAYAAMIALGGDTTTAVVEGGDGSLPLEPAAGSVQILRDEPDFRRLRVQSDGPGFLVVRENYYPGWQAAVDGKPARRYRTNYLFSGFATPAGEHDVTLSFRPSGFRPLLAINVGVLFSALFLALFYRPWRQPRPALFDAPAVARVGRWSLYAILLLFAVLLAVAIFRHRELWDFSHVASPRWM